MKFGVIVLLCVWLALLSSPVNAENNVAPTVAARSSPPQRGTLYRIRHRESTIYLFGTIHVGKPAFYPLEPEVTDALSRAGKLVLEIDIRHNTPFETALQKHGMYAAGDTVDRHLSAGSRAQLEQALQSAGIDFARVKHLKPWLLANMLVSLALEHNGYQRRHGIETVLLSLVDGQATTVQGLESAEYQMALFDSMPDAMQEQYLLENLADLRDGNAINKAQSLIDAWAGANGDALETLLRESLQEKTASADFTRRILLDKRNPEMAAKIEGMLNEGETTFIGVGLLHMVGTNSVPALLRQRGYAVEKLY